MKQPPRGGGNEKCDVQRLLRTLKLSPMINIMGEICNMVEMILKNNLGSNIFISSTILSPRCGYLVWMKGIT